MKTVLCGEIGEIVGEICEIVGEIGEVTPTGGAIGEKAPRCRCSGSGG
jgi:hypothetical protein